MDKPNVLPETLEENKSEIFDKEALELNQIDENRDKRNIGRWKNYNWNLQQYKQDREKRFIGRWKNRNWLNYGRAFPEATGNNYDLDKRADEYLDSAVYANELVPYLYDEDVLDKRQGGRWALIQRQLNRLESNGKSKKDDEYTNDDEISKRMGSRWMLIQNKLRELHGRSKRSDLEDKRFIGRWKNHNWILSHGKQSSDSAFSVEDKRNIGRWKNQNWILQRYRQYRHRKSDAADQ